MPEPAFQFQALQALGQLLVARSLEEAALRRPGCLDGPCVGRARRAFVGSVCFGFDVRACITRGIGGAASTLALRLPEDTHVRLLDGKAGLS